MRKSEIKNVLLRYFVDKEILEESALSFITVESSELEIRKLEIQSQLEFKKLEREEKEREREEKEREREREREKEREREREFERERERERERDRQHELEMKKLEIESSVTHSRFSHVRVSDNFDVTKHIKLVPPFHEKEVDKYFLHFEKIAENLKWPKEHWTLLLQSVLFGKAREIYTQLSLGQASDYDTVKQMILKGYELVPEAYRQKFRNCLNKVVRPMLNFLEQKNNCLTGGVFL